jgi:hypothetical protein
LPVKTQQAAVRTLLGFITRKGTPNSTGLSHPLFLLAAGYHPVDLMRSLVVDAAVVIVCCICMCGYWLVYSAMPHFFWACSVAAKEILSVKKTGDWRQQPMFSAWLYMRDLVSWFVALLFIYTTTILLSAKAS